MTLKPLKNLLAEADAFIGTSASAPLNEVKPHKEIEKIASLLGAANQPIDVDLPPVPSEMEKAAAALNILHAAAEIDMAKRVESFVKKAEKEGYTPEQIDEALGKIAAKRLKESLPILTALGVGHVGFDDKNTPKRERRKLPEGDSKQTVTNISKAVGF